VDFRNEVERIQKNNLPFYQDFLCFIFSSGADQTNEIKLWQEFGVMTKFCDKPDKFHRNLVIVQSLFYGG
jgi:hypothetical protein